MEAYCVKCKAKREMQNAQPLFNSRGAAYTKGTCPVCGTTMMRLGATEAHATLDREAMIAEAQQAAASSQRAEGAQPCHERSRRGKTKNVKQPALSPLKGETGRATEHASRITHHGKLVIVESPAKARTVGRFLGSGYRVRASIGHVRDLPERQMGVDIEHGFRPHYVIAPKKKDVVKELRADAQNAAEIFLATDPDREGESISWHLTAALDDALRGKPIHRVEFHEITRDAIERAFAKPRQINQPLVDAQQARRVLDRIVGYTISPLLRKKINTKNLSAGRVQSVAVRLVVEREREIQAFVPVEYWSIEAELAKQQAASSRQQQAGSSKQAAEQTGRQGDKETRGQGDAPENLQLLTLRLHSGQASNFQFPTVQSSNHLITQSPNRQTFRAKLIKIGDKDFECHTGADALKLKEVLEQCAYVVLDVRRKDVQRNPSPPFITSTMQQEASRKLGFNARRTMAVAQQLYEGLPLGDEGNVGLITYMRTDSTNVAESAQKEAWAYIKQKYGADCLPPSPRVYKKKVAGAQEAHEAIRPTSTFREPNAVKQFLDADQFKLYDLIWKRFVASQMASAVFDTTAVDIAASSKQQAASSKQQAASSRHPSTPLCSPFDFAQGMAQEAAGSTSHPITESPTYLFRANGSILKFRGFLVVYREGKDEPGEKDENADKVLPPLARDEPLDLLGIYPEQHFTEPPPRFTEATLIKALEEKGIGRPSTYAPILMTIQERGYIERMPDRRLKPTDLGFIVNDLLVKHFTKEVDVGFTAQMEEQLDRIAEGEVEWVQVLRDFYAPFKETLDRAAVEMPNVTLPVETTNEVCDKCGAPMVVKRGRFGKFLACSAFPKCKNTRNLSTSGSSAKTGVPCPQCKQGEIIEKRTKRQRTFYSCNRYPDCKFALWDKPVKDPCPKCGGLLVMQKKDRVKCSQCEYVGVDDFTSARGGIYAPG